MSPYLFAVYVDELSIQVGTTSAGCIAGNVVANRLMFADDICVCQCQYQWPSAPLQYVMIMLWNIFFTQKSTKGYKHPARPGVSLSGVSVKFAKQITLLGVILHHASLKMTVTHRGKRNHSIQPQASSVESLASAVLQLKTLCFVPITWLSIACKFKHATEY